MTYSIDTIAALLAQSRRDPASVAPVNTSAAVAMILRQGLNGIELLFILRSLYEKDPWSGNVAFPGGKVMAGESARRAAERETAEEVGLDLGHACYLGQLPVVRGSFKPVQVSCFVYWIGATDYKLKTNGEVHETHWAELAYLDNRDHHLTAWVRFGGDEFEAPAIRLRWPGAPVLWGLTYRLVMHFMEMRRERVNEDEVAFSPGVGKL